MSAEQSSKIRKSSISSQKSFHSIEQFWTNPFDAQVIGRRSKFPIRPAVNILLILLTTLQVFILVHSRIYLRGDLIRTFLSVYMDQDKYGNLFLGQQFYLKIVNIRELSQHFEYLFDNINTINENSFIDMYYNQSYIALHVQYSQRLQAVHKKSTFEIDPKIGIVEPFNMSNLTDMQIFLLQVQRFQLRVENLTVKQQWEGFTQKYLHSITYDYTDSIEIAISFQFLIDDAMIDSDDDDLQEIDAIDQPLNIQLAINSDQQDIVGSGEVYPVIYIVKIRIFYGIVLILAFTSLYLNYLLIRRTFNILYEQLGQTPPVVIDKKQRDNIDHYDQNPAATQSSISRWVRANNITFEQLKFSHYFHILEFDIIFSTLSNIFEIVAGFYLIYGIEKQRIAGIACLLSWLTIFRFVRANKKLVLMYELIKLSIAKVMKFFVQFLPVFIAYALLGVCIFPKVSFYSSLSDSVTTLVCLMMGDSIQMITKAMIQKNSVTISMVYIFTYVLLFMHAIHNTLTSLIKQFFITMKIDLTIKQKQNAGQKQKYVYLQQVQLKSQQLKRQLPLKLTPSLQNHILREKNFRTSFKIIQKLQELEHKFQSLCSIDCHTLNNQFSEKEMMPIKSKQQKQLITEQFERRLRKLEQTIIKCKKNKRQLPKDNYESPLKKTQKNQIKQSLLSSQ